jgi:hypothetical protein
MQDIEILVLHEALKDFQEAIPIAEKDAEESPARAVLRSRLAIRYFESASFS